MSVTDDLKTEAWAPASDLPLILVVLEHADLAAPIRVVNNKTDIISGGETYTAFPVDIVLPSALEDSPPRAQLRISNVSREIGQAIRSISTPPTVTLSVIRQDAPDVVEITFVGMRLANAKWDALAVTGDLEFENLVREPYPAHSFSPAEYPGLIS